MGVDLTGGLAEGREYVFGDQPENSEMRESVNAWIWDFGDEVGMPRIGIEAVADQWATHDIQLNISFANGRVLSQVGPGPVHDPRGHDGLSRTLGAGPLSFELVEPFRHWRMHFEGLARDTSVANQIEAIPPQADSDVPVNIDIEIMSAVPPWENGELLVEAKRVLEEQDEGALMGGPRYEQLSRATGVLRVGDQEWPIDGGALRVRRQGVRRLGTFRGHVWQSAIFPSGKAFGFIVYPPRQDGLPTYNEGYIFDGDGALIPAWVVEAPWLRTLVHRGQDVSVILESERGRIRIAGESVVSCFTVMGGIGPGSEGYPVLQQAIARYTFDGETANGMLERSVPGNRLEKR